MSRPREPVRRGSTHFVPAQHPASSHPRPPARHAAPHLPPRARAARSARRREQLPTKQKFAYSKCTRLTAKTSTQATRIPPGRVSDSSPSRQLEAEYGIGCEIDTLQICKNLAAVRGSGREVAKQR